SSVVLGGQCSRLSCKASPPQTVYDQVWRGMTAIAGSWIGGSANQAAMKELFGVSDQLFSAMITLDVIVAYVWMAVLLYVAGKAKAIDKKMGADDSSIEELKIKMEHFQ